MVRLGRPAPPGTLGDRSRRGSCGTAGPRNGWLAQLSVDPEWTGRKLGSRLVNLAKELRPNGLDLWTFQSNTGRGVSMSSTGSLRRCARSSRSVVRVPGPKARYRAPQQRTEQRDRTTTRLLHSSAPNGTHAPCVLDTRDAGFCIPVDWAQTRPRARLLCERCCRRPLAATTTAIVGLPVRSRQRPPRGCHRCRR